MAKSFGKLPKDYLKSQQARDLIFAISERTNILSQDLIQVKKGNTSEYSQGTWMHEDVALDFAQWLSKTTGLAQINQMSLCLHCQPLGILAYRTYGQIPLLRISQSKKYSFGKSGSHSERR